METRLCSQTGFRELWAGRHPLERLTRLPKIGPKGDLSGKATYQASGIGSSHAEQFAGAFLRAASCCEGLLPSAQSLGQDETIFHAQGFAALLACTIFTMSALEMRSTAAAPTPAAWTN